MYRILCKENVIARRYFYPGCHRLEPYISLYPDTYKRLPVTENISKKVLCLPTNLNDPQKEIQTIAEIIETVHENADELNQWKGKKNQWKEKNL